MDINNKDIWREIPGHDGAYYISIDGEVYSKYKNKLLTAVKTNKGYKRISLYNDNKKKSYLIHRLVANAFIPNPENKPEVNHINFIKDDNRIQNLEWVTGEDNIKHYMDTILPNNFLRKGVVMINQKTNEIRYFNSVNDATRFFYPELIHSKLIAKYSQRIRKVLRGDVKTFKGCIFKFI